MTLLGNAGFTQLAGTPAGSLHFARFARSIDFDFF